MKDLYLENMKKYTLLQQKLDEAIKNNDYKNIIYYRGKCIRSLKAAYRVKPYDNLKHKIYNMIKEHKNVIDLQLNDPKLKKDFIQRKFFSSIKVLKLNKEKLNFMAMQNDFSNETDYSKSELEAQKEKVKESKNVVSNKVGKLLAVGGISVIGLGINFLNVSTLPKTLITLAGAVKFISKPLKSLLSLVMEKNAGRSVANIVA